MRSIVTYDVSVHATLVWSILKNCAYTGPRLFPLVLEICQVKTRVHDLLGDRNTNPISKFDSGCDAVFYYYYPEQEKLGPKGNIIIPNGEHN